MTTHAQRDAASVDPIKDATLAALGRILDPLLDLMFDAGVTVQEFNRIAREVAVRTAILRVLKAGGRESKSRVAIMTGLPRSEVTRILSSLESAERSKPVHHPARRVLAAWHDDTRFLASDGRPAVLSIYGKRRSFENLVEGYGAGLPVRAMLDELVQLDAVEFLDDQKIRAKARVPVTTGLTNQSLTAMGERGRDLLETLVHNMRVKAQPFFEATTFVDDGGLDMVALLRREIADQGTNFINSATSLLNRSQSKRSSNIEKSPRTCRLGVTVYYFQEQIPNDDPVVPTHTRRKNLRRRVRKSIDGHSAD